MPRRGGFEAYLLAWSGRIDPDGNLYVFLHTGGPQNYGHYSNPADGQAAGRRPASSRTRPSARRSTARLPELTQKDLPISYIYTIRYFAGLSAKVAGFKPVPDGMIRLQGITGSRHEGVCAGRLLQVLPTCCWSASWCSACSS